MKTTLVWTMIVLTIIFTLALFVGLPHTVAADYTTLNLPEGAKARLGKGDVAGVVYSPDGSLLAVAGSAGTWLYDAETYQERALLTGHSASVQSVAFSPDGKTIATGSIDRTVRLWEVATATLIHTLKGHNSHVPSVTFSPDGKTIASASRDGTVRLWDVATATLKHTLTEHTDDVWSVAFSPDGKLLASGSEDNTVRLWDVATATLKYTLTEHTDYAHSVVFSPDGKTIAIGSIQKVTLYDVTKATLKHTLTGHRYAVLSVAFSPDGNTIASGGADYTVRLWDANTATHKHTLTGYTYQVDSVAFNPDGKTIATASGVDASLWDVETATHIHSLPGHTSVGSNVTFSPDGKTIASANWTEVNLWDVETATHKYSLPEHRQYVYSVAFSPDGETIATGGYGHVSLWDVETATKEYELIGHTDVVVSVAFSPDGKTIASGGADATVRLWDAATGTLKHTLTEPLDEVLNVAFSPDGKTIAAAVWGWDATVRLWDVATGRHKYALTGEFVTFSPDGETIATSNYEMLYLWDVATARRKATLEHTDVVASVAFGPDGKTIVSGSSGVVRLWDVETSTQIHTFIGHTSYVYSLSFSPDATTLASVGDGTVLLWNLTPYIDIVQETPDTEDIPGPTVTILTPSADQVFIRGNTTITGNFTGTAVPISLKLTINGTSVEAEVSENTFTYTPAEALAVDYYTLIAEVADANGKTAQATVNFHVGEPGLPPIATGTEIPSVDATVTVVPSPSEPPLIGEQLKLNLNVTGGKNIAGFTAVLTFDETALSFVSSTEGDFLPEGTYYFEPYIGESRNGEYIVSISATQRKEESNGDGTLATLTFDVISEKTSTLTIGIRFFDSEGTYSQPQLEYSEGAYTEPYPGALEITITPMSSSPLDDPDSLTTLRSDTFDGSGQNLQSFWEVQNGDKSPYELKDGKLVVEGGYNQNLWTNDTSTRFYQNTDEDAFTAETSFVFDHDNSSSVAGLVISSPTTRDWVTLKVWGRSTDTVLQFQHRGRGITGDIRLVDNPPKGDIPIALRLQRNGDNYTAWYKPETEGEWVHIGSTTITLQEPIQVGVYVGIQATTGHLTVSFDYFEVSSDPITPVETPSEDATVRFSSPAVETLRVGDQLTLNMDVASGKNIKGYQATIQFDETVLRYVSSANADFLLPNTYEAPPIIKEDTVTIAATSYAEETNGDGTLATLTFDVIGTGTTTVTLTEVLFSDSEGTLTRPHLESLEITTIMSYLREDVNRDGVVDFQDLMLVDADFTKIGEYVTDVNEDGVVNIADLVLVAEALDDNTTAAAATLNRAKGQLPAAEKVALWLEQARQLNLTDPKSLRGIRLLKQLLLVLAPEKTALLPNYPNPFNPETWIPYQLANPADVHFTIYASDGKLVRKLDIGHQQVGIYHNRSRAAYWDGKNSIGETVASGLYYYTLTAGDFSATRRMLILK